MRRLILRFIAVVACVVATSVVETSSASAASCRDGGFCVVGNIGPGGGIVFYDAGSLQWWGRYLEFKGTLQWVVPWSPSELASVSVYPAPVAGISVFRQQVLSKAIGMGRKNTAAILGAYGQVGNFAARVGSMIKTSPKTDWYLPSKDEADALYNYLKTGGRSAGNAAQASSINRNFAKSAMWTSSEASDSFAWYQLFVDGTQFTDANGIIPGLKGNKATTVTPYHAGSFLPMRRIATPVRAFPAGSGSQSSKSNGAYEIGAVGPGGGIVFFDAGSQQSWGRYLEVAPADCEGIQISWRPLVANLPRLYADTFGGFTAAQKRVLSKALGAGRSNTELIVNKYKSISNYAALYSQNLVCHEAEDWFLPSKNELDLVFNNLKALDSPIGGFDKGYYWTSSEYNNENAWTQYFNDGQQFDRVKSLSANKAPPQRPFRVRAIRAFG